MRDGTLAYDSFAAVLSGDDALCPIFPLAVRQGGYAPTPANAAIEDQVFLLLTALEVDSRQMNSLQQSK